MDEHDEQTQHSEHQDYSASNLSADTDSEKPTGVGPIIGVVIIVIVLIIGGLYFWGAQLVEKEAPEESVPSNDADQSLQNNTGSIESDFEDFNMAAFEANLESDMQAAENEF
jgi:uncharacterized protein HemX